MVVSIGQTPYHQTQCRSDNGSGHNTCGIGVMVSGRRTGSGSRNGHGLVDNMHGTCGVVMRSVVIDRSGSAVSVAFARHLVTHLATNFTTHLVA